MERLLTYEQMNKLDRDGHITELIAKVFYNHAAPSTAHQRISGNLFNILYNFLRKKPIGEAFPPPYDVIFSEENVVQPDLIYVKKENAHIIKPHGIEGIPDLIVEVISNESYDIKKKIPLYATYEVPYLWYLDPNELTLKAYRLEGAEYKVTEVLTSTGSFTHDCFPGLTIAGAEVFRDVI